MIYDYMAKYDMDYLGCIAIIDEQPLLFIIYDDNILDGLPLLDIENQYTIINELAPVATEHDEEEKFNISLLDDYDINFNLMTYNIMPLYIHTLKTRGLAIEDILELGFFDVLTFSVLYDFLKETTN